MKTIIYLFLLFFIHYANAAGQFHADVHTHGEGHVTVVYENGKLLVELTTPAANMLGFEDQPHTEQQKQVLGKLVQALHEPDQLIVLHPGCKIKDIIVKLPFKLDVQKKPYAQNTHSASVNRSYEEKDDVNGHDEHRDIHTHYEWYCLKPSLPRLTLNYFHLYSGFETINVEWVVNSTQGYTRLNKNKNRLEFVQ